ncbi:DUF262 domain-containing protein [Deinococcus antarcticus]|uniref:DUF262 domain-containing protein n=1 Tax=Deinococcus antarcticus TaxID=1298767 RepID=A0ABV8A852_9DEIO
MSPTNYVLDGQQRLTVVYSCFGAPEVETGFSAVYNLLEEKFEEFVEPDPYKFNLRNIFDTTKLLNFRAGLISHKDSAVLQQRLDKLVDSVHNYKFPVVTLKDLSIEEVGVIFERINSSGTKLSVYDLMVAATWTQNFSLDENVQEILLSLETKRFNDLEPNTVLKCMAAVNSASVKKKSIFELRDLKEHEISLLTERTKDALLKSVDFFSNEFNVFGSDFLPYEAQLITICYVFSVFKSLSSSQAIKLRKWFWQSSFGERYRVGGENFLTNDLESIKKYLEESEAIDSMDFGALPNARDLEKIQFRKNNSRSVAYTLAMSLLKPRSIVNGTAVELQQSLSVYNQRNFHHFYPKAHLKRLNNDDNANAITNIIFLSASDNISISDADPVSYVSDCVSNLEEMTDDVFSSNLLPAPSKFDYTQESFESFISERAKLIEAYIKSLIG